MHVVVLAAQKTYYIIIVCIVRARQYKPLFRLKFYFTLIVDTSSIQIADQT